VVEEEQAQKRDLEHCRPWRTVNTQGDCGGGGRP
jgi:hypothetical protein